MIERYIRLAWLGKRSRWPWRLEVCGIWNAWQRYWWGRRRGCSPRSSFGPAGIIHMVTQPYNLWISGSIKYLLAALRQRSCCLKWWWRRSRQRRYSSCGPWHSTFGFLSEYKWYMVVMWEWRGFPPIARFQNPNPEREIDLSWVSHALLFHFSPAP